MDITLLMSGKSHLCMNMAYQGTLIRAVAMVIPKVHVSGPEGLAPLPAA